MPATRSKKVPAGSAVRIKAAGQKGLSVLAGGVLEQGTWTQWSPTELASGVTFRPQFACTVEFYATFLDKKPATIQVDVTNSGKPLVSWTVKSTDGKYQSWQLWLQAK